MQVLCRLQYHGNCVDAQQKLDGGVHETKFWIGYETCDNRDQVFVQERFYELGYQVEHYGVSESNPAKFPLERATRVIYIPFFRHEPRHIRAIFGDRSITQAEIVQQSKTGFGGLL
jgi:hypothetical protein